MSTTTKRITICDLCYGEINTGDKYNHIVRVMDGLQIDICDKCFTAFDRVAIILGYKFEQFKTDKVFVREYAIYKDDSNISYHQEQVYCKWCENCMK